MGRDRWVGGWLVLVGVGMLGVWTALFATGSVDEPFPSFLFHLAAEAGTALLALAAGIGSLRGRPAARGPSVLALGAVTCAAGGASGFYLAGGDAAAAGVLGALSALSAGLAFLPAPRVERLVRFGTGLCLYAVLNAAALFAEAGNQAMVGLHVAAFALLAWREATDLTRTAPPGSG